MSTIQQLFIGAIQPLPPDGQPSGIFKARVSGPVYLDFEGLAGDAQADRRYHGGREKALHQYAAQNYPRLATMLDAPSLALQPGCLGENVSSDAWDEQSVCIGDVFAMGGARVQVSQPRSPCWKINRRLGVEGASKAISQARITGWYYRVLACGMLTGGAPIELLQRAPHPVSIDHFLLLVNTHRPALDDFVCLLDMPGLAADWQCRINQRFEWLRGL